MTLEEAFKDFLENVAPKVTGISTLYSWRRRYEAGQLTHEKQHELLKENGYHLVRYEETWQKPGGPYNLTFLFTLEREIKTYTVEAANIPLGKSAVKAKYKGAQNVTDITGMSDAELIKKVNTIINGE